MEPLESGGTVVSEKPNFDQLKEIKTELEDLIQKRTELQLFLQPIVYFSDSKTFGYEVLSRGAVDTSLETLSPFPLAYTYNLGKELDRIALDTVVDKIETLPDVHIFVNCFLTNLEYFYDLVKDRNITRNIVVEIDFSTELVDIKDVLSGVEKLTSLPFISFAIDDLGKYSLDRQLYDIIKPSFLKVDICLTKGISDDVRKQKMVDDIIVVANEVNSTLIFEGVEDRVDANYLKSHGFELAQGNIYMKPKHNEFFNDAD